MPQDVITNPDLGILAGLAAFFAVYSFVLLAVNILLIVSFWVIFKKAWKPGWAAIIPFYNLYVFFQVSWWNWWNFLWILVFPVFIILIIIAQFDLARKFGKSAWWGLWLLLLQPIFYPILAFDGSKYDANA